MRSKGWAGLGLAAVLGLGTLSGAAAASDHDVSVMDNFYEPKTLTVTAGTTVTWLQVQYQPHTVTAKDGSWNSHPGCQTFSDAEAGKCMKFNEKYSRTFSAQGTYEYYCTIHGESMTGTIVVTAAQSPTPTTPSPTPTTPKPSLTPTVSPTPSPTVSPAPTVTASPTPTPTPSPASETPSEEPSEEPSESASPSAEPSTASPSASEEPSAEPSSDPEPSEDPSLDALPIGSEDGGGRTGLIVALVALVAVGLAAFGFWQLRRTN